MNPDNRPQDDPYQSQDPQNRGPYPGFGQRHDIFYQYEPPEADAMPPPPPQISEDARYAPILREGEAYDYEAEAPPGRKKVLIGAAILLTLMAGAGIFLLLKHKGPAPQASNNNQTATVDPDLVNTSCFEFKLPKPHVKLDTSIASCGGSYYTGSDQTAGVVINPITAQFSTLDDIITAWKQSNPNINVTSQKAADFGQYSAAQMFWTPKASPTETWMSVLVYTPQNSLDAKYIEQGAGINGFEIDGRYDSNSTSKSVYDNILSTWIWK